jgi:hypothetical protein
MSESISPSRLRVSVSPIPISMADPMDTGYYARFGAIAGVAKTSNHMHAIHVYAGPQGIRPIGEAFRTDCEEEDRGPASWTLTIRGNELPGRYTLVDNRFLPAPG